MLQRNRQFNRDVLKGESPSTFRPFRSLDVPVDMGDVSVLRRNVGLGSRNRLHQLKKHNVKVLPGSWARGALMRLQKRRSCTVQCTGHTSVCCAPSGHEGTAGHSQTLSPFIHVETSVLSISAVCPRNFPCLRNEFHFQSQPSSCFP